MDSSAPGLPPPKKADPRRRITDSAIRSIFFPRTGETRAVLLKRGPVFAEGEERELLLFTNGFLLCDVELDARVDALLDASSGRTTARTREDEEGNLRRRFSAVDADQSGALDPEEVRELFRSMGMALDRSALRDLINMFDVDSNGVICFQEFKAMMRALHRNEGDGRAGSTWDDVGEEAKRALVERGIARKPRVAVRIREVVGVDGVDDDPSAPEFARLTMAIRVEGVERPLVVSLSKPGHLAAWLEAFRVCIARADERASGHDRRSSLRSSNNSEEWRLSKLDWGADCKDGGEDDRPDRTADGAITPENKGDPIGERTGPNRRVRVIRKQPSLTGGLTSSFTSIQSDDWRTSKIDWGAVGEDGDKSEGDGTIDYLEGEGNSSSNDANTDQEARAERRSASVTESLHSGFADKSGDGDGRRPSKIYLRGHEGDCGEDRCGSRRESALSPSDPAFGRANAERKARSPRRQSSRGGGLHSSLTSLTGSVQSSDWRTSKIDWGVDSGEEDEAEREKDAAAPGRVIPSNDPAPGCGNARPRVRVVRQSSRTGGLHSSLTSIQSDDWRKSQIDWGVEDEDEGDAGGMNARVPPRRRTTDDRDAGAIRGRSILTSIGSDDRRTSKIDRGAAEDSAGPSRPVHRNASLVSLTGSVQSDDWRTSEIDWGDDDGEGGGCGDGRGMRRRSREGRCWPGKRGSEGEACPQTLEPHRGVALEPHQHN